jgi:DNA-binding SARP family transcriptional activator/tetratricopeptide (TPR) repeat protein
VLAFLLLRAPRQASVDQLIEALWSEWPPKSARNSVQRFVSDIRRALGPYAARLELVADGYRLEAFADEIDVTRAEAAITAGRASGLAHDPLSAAKEYRRALGLWRGPALGGGGDAPFATGEVARLEEMRMTTVEAVLDAELKLGRHLEIAVTAEHFAHEHPTRERAWSLLMLALYRCDRETDALAAYRHLSWRLKEEQGLEPSLALQNLSVQIDERAPELDAPSALDIAAESELIGSPLKAGLAIPIPRPLEGSSRFPMVGRSTEVARISALRDSLVDGAAAVVFIEGEGGIGKTRLAAEVAAEFHRGGMPVVYGRCEENLVEPYQPWVEVFEQLVEHAPPAMIRNHLDRFGDSLSVLVPRLVASDPFAPTESSNRQEMLFRSALGFVDAAAEEQPLLLILDGLQWADASTLHLLRHVARRVTSSLLVIGAYRHTEVSPSHPMTDLLGVLQGEAKVTVIRLAGLSAQAASELVDSAPPSKDARKSDEIAATLLQETNGNPFFMTEILQSTQETGAIFSQASLEGNLPESIRCVVRQRTARLGESALKALQTASVLGREFELELLARVLSRDAFDVLDPIETAIEAGLVTEAPRGRDRFSFSHDLTHRTLYHGLSESRRWRIHARVADCIEEKLGGDLGDRIGEVATHLVAAADPAQRERTILACRRAGDRAAAQYAPTEAVSWFKQAIEVLMQGDEPDDVLRAGLLVSQGTQQRNSGDPRHKETLLEAGAIANEVGAVGTLVESVLANSLRLNARGWEIDEERVASIRSALAAIGLAPSAERARLLAVLANEQWDEPNRAEAESLYRDAIALAREVGDPAALATVLVRISRARNFRLPRAELHAVSNEIAGLIRGLEHGDPLLAIDCLTTVLNTALQLGLADEATRAMENIWETEERFGLPIFTHPAHLARVLQAGLRGDAAEYERLALQTRNVSIDLDEEEATYILEGHLFYARYVQGRTGELLPVIVAIAEGRPEVPLYRAVSAILHAEALLLDEASTIVSTELARGFEVGVDMFAIQSLTLWAEAAASVGHLEGCRVLLDRLAPHSTEMAGHLVQVTQPIDLALGRMCSVLGLYDDALAHFELSAKIADGFGAVWMDVRTKMSIAQMLGARAAAGDLERARVIADLVCQVAKRQGYAAIERDAETLLRDLAPS